MKGNTHKRSSVTGTSFRGSASRLTAGARGPLSFQNITLHEKMAALNSAKSTAMEPNPIYESLISADTYATGTFKVTNDITDFTKAKIFSKLGKEFKVLVRISKDINELINSNPERDPIEFAIKFYTEDGNWDLKAKNLPVNVLGDSREFLDKIHSKTNTISPTRFWDFMSTNPESLQNVLMKFSDRATPVGYRHMNTYGERIFTMTNAKNEKFLVKFHLKTMQGIRNFTGEEALELHIQDPDFANRDLVRAIDEKDFPKWELKMQVMTPDQANEFVFNPFDPTKVWPQIHFPLIDIGEIELNEIPETDNEVEKIDFNSPFEMDGIDHSSDVIDLIDEKDQDYYTQSQRLFNRVMNDYNRENLIRNIVNSMHNIEGEERENIIARQISHFFRIDVALGGGVAKGLGVDLISVLNELKKHEMELA